MDTSPRQALRAYALAVVIVAVTTAVRFALGPFLGTRMPSSLFLIAILFAGRYGGYGPSWLALALGAIPVSYLQLTRSGTFDPFNSASQTSIAMYLALGTIIIFLSESQRAARDAAVKNAADAVDKQRLLEREIAERQAVEQQLRDQQQQLELALQAGRLGTWSWDIKTGQIHSSATQAIIHGRSPDRTMVAVADSLENIHPDDRHIVKDAMERAVRNEPVERVTYRVKWPDSSTHWVESVGKVFHDEAGRPDRVLGVSIDITQLKQTTEALIAEGELLKNLMEIQENEKQFICYDIHDGLIQYVAGALMLVEGYTQNQPADDGAASLEKAIASLRRAVDEGRRVIQGVRSHVLDHSGLVAGIEDLIHQVSGTGLQVSGTGLSIDFDKDDRIGRLPNSLETAVYRVIQEALTNVRKHSGSPRAAISLRRTNSQVRVEVRDFGRGFAMQDVRRNAFGLLGMIERTRLLGGECSIHSEPGTGTQVVAIFPIGGEGNGTASPN